MAIESTVDLPVDFLIITSLDKEFESLIRTLPSPTTQIASPDGASRSSSCDLPITLPDGSASIYRLLALQQASVGRVSAAIFASNAIRQFQPRYLLLVGIAGGVRDKLQLGDILVADQIVDYEQQKLVSERAEPSWQVYRPDPLLLSSARKFAHGPWTKLIKAKRPVRGRVKVHIGPIASGDKVLASQDEVANLLKHWPRLNGVEMEGSGVAAAIDSTPPAPGFLMIRAIADLVGDLKGSKLDEWREYATAVASAFAIGFLTSVPVKPSHQLSVHGDSPPESTETSSTILPLEEVTSEAKTVTESDESTELTAYFDELSLSPLRLASYDPDSPSGSDLLGIEADVNAFASVIAAHTTSPPLSIGVFGEWGYGKTFFMRQLKNRVAQIASDAQASGRLQKDIAYYKRIVQIEFNAWHYIEGNLWASLVEHILFNLQVVGSPQDEVQALQTRILSELGIQTLAKSEIEAKVEQVKGELTAIERLIAEKNKELDDKTEKIQTLTATNIIATVMALPETGVEIEKLNLLRSDLNLPAITAGIDDMGAAIAEAEAVVGRGTALFMPIVSARDRKRRLIWLLILLLSAPVVGVVVAWLLAARGNQWITQVGAILATLTTWMYVLVGGLRRATSWVAERIARIERLKQHLEARVESEKAHVLQQITELKNERQELHHKYLEQQQQLEAVQNRMGRLEDELKRATPHHLLATLIQDRVQSDDYRKHLGLLALVRRDFEKMSKFIEAENQRLSTFQTIEDEEEGIESRINRIVLYIDDLDRCPTEKVVQVLQAIHLLLAFPLFVVVVAVDARWISGALREQYGLLLGAQNDHSQPRGPRLDHSDSATTLDYLEKIFQIPFWLSPMNRAARKHLIEGLIPLSESKDSGTSGPMQPPNEGDSAELLASAGEPTPQLAATDDIAIEAEETFVTDLNPVRLVIRPGELSFINDMNVLLGRSPRALKRFVNIYRLIKSSVPESYEVPFDGKRADLDDDLKIAMFFLAVITNSPDLSKEFFKSLHEAMDQRKRRSVLHKSDWDKLLTPKDRGNQPQWNQIKVFLGLDIAQPIREATIERLTWWASRISRFSFYESTVLQWTDS